MGTSVATSYTTKDIPEGLWVHWKRLVPRERTLGSRNIQLFAADVACQRKHDMGLLEYAIEHDIVDGDDINEALDLDEPTTDSI